jgi:hypothetical protein
MLARSSDEQLQLKITILWLKLHYVHKVSDALRLAAMADFS